MTRGLFSTEGLAAVHGLAAHRSLLMFDLDGTLAPIVSCPGDAAVPEATARRLRCLAQRWPVAVITGRSLADAVDRLGFSAHYVVGNHGAESAHGGRNNALRLALDPCRQRLRDRDDSLHEHGIDLEDKGLSLALHYRGALDRPAAVAWLAVLVQTLGVTVHATHGHCVVNISPAGAKDKGDALLDIFRDCRASACLVIGDDENDEPAFIKAPAGSVSVRIGSPGNPTKARFRLASQRLVNPLLDVLLGLHHEGRQGS